MVGHRFGGLGFALSCCDLDSTFELAIVTLTFKIQSGVQLGNRRCKKLILGRDIGWGV